MRNKIIILAVALILIVLSFSYGYRVGLEVPQASILEKSKVIQYQYATAQGEVAEISGRTLILTEGGRYFVDSS